MKRLGIVIIVFVLLMPVMFACGRSSRPIKIGVAASLTGVTSEIGINGRNAVSMAVEDINAAGGIDGRPLEAVYMDDGYSGQKAREVDVELKKQGVDVIVGHYTSGMAKNVGKFLKDNELIMVSPTISGDGFTGQDDNFIRVMSSNRNHARYVADNSVRISNVSRAAIIYESTNKGYADLLSDFYNQRLMELGCTSSAIFAYVSGKDVDYSGIIAKALNTKPDALFIVAPSFDSALFCQQKMKVDSNVPVYFSAWSMGSDLLRQGGKSVEGAYLISLIDYESKVPAYVDFAKRYREKYAEDPNFSAVSSYDAVKLIADAYDKAKSSSVADLKSAMIGRTFSSLQGEMHIDKYGDCDRPVYLYTIRNGAYAKVD